MGIRKAKRSKKNANPNMSLNIILRKPEVIIHVVRRSNSSLYNQISSALTHTRPYLLKSTRNVDQVTGFTERLLLLPQKTNKKTQAYLRFFAQMFT